MHRICRGAAVALCLLAAVPLHGQQYEQGLIEIHVRGTTPHLAKVLVDTTGRVFLPLSDVLDVTEIPNTRTPAEWVLQWPPPGFDTRIDPTTGRITVPGQAPDSLSRSEFVAQPPEIFLDLAALQRLLAIRAVYSPEDLMVTLTANGGFPINRRQDLDRRLRTSERSSRFRSSSDAVPYHPVTGGYALNWHASISRGTAEPAAASVRSSFGGALLGGEYEIAGSAAAGVSGRRELFGRYNRPFPNSNLIQQLSVGAVTTPTPAPVFINGVIVSNAPYLPPEFFQSTIVQPNLPAGWLAEIYEGPYLLGVAESSDESIQVPLGYGFNRVNIRMIGPAGQERTEELQYLVPQRRIPVGTLRYAAGGGRCRDASCDSYLFGEASAGLDLGLTVGLGLDRAAKDSITVTRPFISFGASPRSNLTVDMRAAPSWFEQLDVQFAGPRNEHLSLALAHTRRRAPASFDVPGWRGVVNASFRIGERSLTTLGQVVRSDDGVSRVLLSAGTMIGRSFVFTQIDRIGRTPDVLSLRMTRGISNLPGLKRHLTLGLSTGVTRDGLHSASGSASTSVPALGTLAFSSQWQTGTAPSLSLTFFTRRPQFTGTARAVSRDRDASAVLSASGSLVLTPEADVRAFPEGALGLGGAAGSVFIDENGNGIRDDDEAGVADVTLFSLGSRAVSSSDGSFTIWGLRPVQAVDIAVDTLSIPDTQLVPVRPVVTLRPVPNAFLVADFPLVRSREITGSITSQVPTGLGGISIEIRTLDGVLIADSRTFSDGGFYFPRVPPGDFLALIAPASQAALGLTPQPAAIRFTVPSVPGPTLQLPAFTLTRTDR